MAPNPKTTHDDTRNFIGHRPFNDYSSDLGFGIRCHLAFSRVQGMSALWSVFSRVFVV